MTLTDPLLQPFQLKHLTLRNRLMMTSHEPNYAEDGLPTERYRLYHLERAKGGIALTMTAGSALVSRDSPAAFGNLHAYRDEIVPHLRQIADDCHAHGTAVMIQITHLGRRTSWNHSDWLPVVAASPLREPAHRAFPKAAEDWDIERIVTDYAAAAQRMQDAGLDGIELEAYGHLLDGFWSPAFNQRTDAFGGSLENRMRMSQLVIDAIRKAVGADFIIGIRMVADEVLEGGLSAAEGKKIASILAGEGKIDFLNIIRGHIDTDAGLSDVIPVAGMPASPHLDFAGDIRQATRFPVFHAAKIADVATARHAIAEGKLDMVGMTRAHIADPHIALKVAERREDDIRPCVGATYCLDRIYEGHEALCIHNASTGREATLPHVISKAEQNDKKRVVIVGAGPAGLEAARVCAERGHDVKVFEAAPHPGGQITLAARSKRRRDLIGIIDWRMSQCEKRGVAFNFNTYAEADTVAEENPDIVLVATGGLPNTAFLQDGEDLVATSWDILSGDVAPGENVLVFDDNGAHPGMQAAEHLAQSGATVEIITPERFFAPEIGGLNHVAYAKTFQQHDVRITLNTRLRSVTRNANTLRAHLVSDYDPTWTAQRDVDQIVVEHGTLPLDDLYFDLKPLSANAGRVDYTALVEGGNQTLLISDKPSAFRLYRLGDAISSRNIHAAIYDAARLCANL